MRSGGTLFTFGRLAACLLAAAACLFIGPSTTHAASTLELARDFTSSTAYGIPNVTHEFYFVLPTDSNQILPTDWIVIDMPNYQNVTSLTYMDGGLGTASYSVTGTTLKVTGLALLPGQGITLGGATARNPSAALDARVTVKVSDTQNAAIVRNQISIYPSSSGNFISVEAIVTTVLSALSIDGYTSPGAFVTLSDSGAILGTTVSDGSGFFRFSITGIDPGAKTYRVSSTDTGGLATSTSSLNVFLLAGNLTNVTGILLSPALQVFPTSIDPGQAVTISGTAKPSSQINLFVEAPLRGYNTTSDTAGHWAYTIPGSETSGFTPGQYQAYALVQDSIGNQSIVSPTTNFTVNAPADPDNPPPACDISHGDLNCDGKTNLTDFSILIFHWQTNHKKADINADTHVNLTDFSIMMFYFVR